MCHNSQNHMDAPQFYVISKKRNTQYKELENQQHRHIKDSYCCPYSDGFATPIKSINTRNPPSFIAQYSVSQTKKHYILAINGNKKSINCV